MRKLVVTGATGKGLSVKFPCVDAQEQQSRAERHVRPSAGAGGRGLGVLPNKHIGNGKGYPDDLLAGSIFTTVVPIKH